MNSALEEFQPTGAPGELSVVLAALTFSLYSELQMGGSTQKAKTMRDAVIKMMEESLACMEAMELCLNNDISANEAIRTLAEQLDEDCPAELMEEFKNNSTDNDLKRSRELRDIGESIKMVKQRIKELKNGQT